MDKILRIELHTHTVRLESLCALRLLYVDLVVSIEIAVEVCVKVISTLSHTVDCSELPLPFLCFCDLMPT
jgi:hypothetical protein